MAWWNPLEGLKSTWEQNPLDWLTPESYNPLNGLSWQSEVIGKNNIDFWDVIDFFEKPENSHLKWFIPAIQELEESLGNNLTPEIKKELKKLIESNNHNQLLFYIKKLQDIQIQYDTAEQEVTNKAKESEKAEKSNAGWWNDFENPIAWVEWKLWPSEDLAKIKNISLDGNIENVAAFTRNIEKLKWVLPSLLVFQNLGEEDRAEFLKFLDSISSTLLEQEKKNLSFIEDQYNWLAEQIEQQSDWQVVLDLGSSIWEIPFASKEEAFRFILETKQASESELESWSTNTSEAVWSLLLKWLYYSLNTFSYPYQLYAGKFEETYNDFTNDEHWSETYIWNGIGLILWGILTINYTETLWRRIVKDTLGKFWVKRYVFENFDRRQLTFRPDDGGAEKQAEFNNRLDAYRALEELWATKTWKEKIAFDKEMEDILNYMRINTNTYWLKVKALREWKWIIGRGIYAFKYGPNFTPYNIAQQEQSIANANNEKFQSDLKKDLTYVFRDPSFDVTENGRILRVNHWWESDNITYLKNYINSRGDISESEKKSRIKRINDFLNWLETHPRWEKFIKAELISISKEGQLSIDEVKAKLEEKYPFLKEVSDDGSKKTISQQWWEIKSAIAKAYGNNTPLPSYTRGHALAFRFLLHVESGQWNGNQNQLNEIFKMIDSGKFEISHIYKYSLVNPKRWLDVATWVFWRYGIQTPELTQLRRVSEWYSSQTLEEITKIWKDFEENHKKLKDILEKWYDIDGKRYTPIQALENYIKYDIPDAEEARLKPIFDDFIQLIKDGKIILSPTELFREIEKLKNGFMPSPVLLEKLNKLREEELKKAAKSVEIEKKSIIDRLKFLEISLADRPEIDISIKKAISQSLKEAYQAIKMWEFKIAIWSIETIFTHNIWPKLKETLQQIIRWIKRIFDIRIKLKKSETGEKVWAYETRYDSFIEEAKNWRLNITEKEFLDVKNGKFEFDSYASYVWTDFTKSDGENFVKSMEEFQNLHKYDFRTSLWISVNAWIPEIEKTFRDKFKVEIELATIYDYMDGRASSIWNDIALFARLSHWNDFTRWQAKSILDLIFIDWKAFWDIDTDAIIRGTTDNASEFDGKDTLRNGVLEKFNKLDESGKKAILEYIRNSSSIDRNNLPPAIQDELKKFEWADEAQKLINKQKSTIQSMIDEIETTDESEDLKDLKKRFDAYVDNPAHQIDRDSDVFKDLINDFKNKHSEKRAELSRAIPTPKPDDTDVTPSPVKPDDPSPKPAPVNPETQETLKPGEMKEYLDDVYPSILLYWDESAEIKFNELYGVIYTEQWIKDFHNLRNFEDYVAHHMRESGMVPKKIDGARSSNFVQLRKLIAEKSANVDIMKVSYRNLMNQVKADTRWEWIRKFFLEALEQIKR